MEGGLIGRICGKSKVVWNANKFVLTFLFILLSAKLNSGQNQEQE